MLGERILQSISRDQVARLLEVAVAALSADQMEQVCAALDKDGGETLRRVLQTQGHFGKSRQSIIEGLDPLCDLWQSVLYDVSTGEGRHWIFENRWEPPYLDSGVLVSDLEESLSRSSIFSRTARTFMSFLVWRPRWWSLTRPSTAFLTNTVSKTMSGWTWGLRPPE